MTPSYEALENAVNTYEGLLYLQGHSNYYIAHYHPTTVFRLQLILDAEIPEYDADEGEEFDSILLDEPNFQMIRRISKLYQEDKPALKVDDALFYGIVLYEAKKAFGYHNPASLRTKRKSKGVAKQEVVRPQDVIDQPFIPEDNDKWAL
jgi:hypothetical protein